jgi:amidophosphoribosyltransferase
VETTPRKGLLPLVPHDDVGRTGDGPKDECGVFGVFAPGEDVARLTFYGLYALQHRGQESAGMAVSDGERIVVTKDMGLVNQVFTESALSALEGRLAIGHVRYSTTGTSSWANAQPQYRESHGGGQLALCHNGNLCNTADIARRGRSTSSCARPQHTTTSRCFTSTMTFLESPP